MSPFTRRVAVSLKIQGVEFEHLDLSTATDRDEVRKYNPMVRVPTVVLDDNTTLIDSDAILDWFDEKAGPKDRLIPESGESRRNVLQLVSWATAAGDKTVIAFYERTRRPENMVYLPSVEGAETQLLEAFEVLENSASGSKGWLVGDRITQADVSAIIFLQFARIVLPHVFDKKSFPALDRLREKAYRSYSAFLETDPQKS